jgi:hypothetical protein
VFLSRGLSDTYGYDNLGDKGRIIPIRSWPEAWS